MRPQATSVCGLNAIREQVCAQAAAALEPVQDVYGALGSLSRAVEARRGVAEQMLREGDSGKLRDLLYLDLALEGQTRLIIESWLPSLPSPLLPLCLALAAESLLVTLRFSCGACGSAVYWLCYSLNLYAAN